MHTLYICIICNVYTDNRLLNLIYIRFIYIYHILHIYGQSPILYTMYTLYIYITYNLYTDNQQ